MNRRRKNCGITLIEQLLAIAVIAIIIMFSIQRGRIYQQQVQIKQVKVDLNTILYAVNNYFHVTGCLGNGNFAGKPQPSFEDDLKLKKSDLRRPHLLQDYKATIQKLDNPGVDNRPLYQFIISASANHLSPQKIHYILSKTNGYSNDNDTSLLQWKTLPAHELNQTNNNWILASRLRKFKKTLEQNSTGSNQSHCAQ